LIGFFVDGPHRSEGGKLAEVRFIGAVDRAVFFYKKPNVAGAVGLGILGEKVGDWREETISLFAAQEVSGDCRFPDFVVSAKGLRPSSEFHAEQARMDAKRVSERLSFHLTIEAKHVFKTCAFDFYGCRAHVIFAKALSMAASESKSAFGLRRRYRRGTPCWNESASKIWSPAAKGTSHMQA
jgi:hypothetical protein